MSEQAGRPHSGVGGRRLAAGTGLALSLVLGVALPASAQPAASAAPADPAGPVARCQLTDPRLPEVSGLVEVGDRMLVHNDGGDRLDVYVLDQACAVVTVQSAALDPYDPEDMALAVDGTVWLADTGDNTGTRETVALLALRPDGSSSVYRLTFPDGPRDVEALLLAPDGTPYLVSKEVLGASAVYRPVSALAENGTVGLAEVAGVDFTLTGTPGGPVGRAGQLMVTGGAVSPDGRWIALRTYTDAYVWPLSGSDVVGALAAEPRRVALPTAPQGEAVSFTGDSSALVVAGEGLPGDVTVVPVPAAPSPAAPSEPPDGALTDLLGTDGGPSPIPAAVAAAAAAAVLVWLGSRLRGRSG
ncbi:hypothetical protein E4P41_08670 [Geodermatophilus sp. DF01-2]|uniref:hypothetical protein n=1 Tax=Geodermatophilus sp. DF01-2 TaxID=2559610 RepID=UPI0010735ABF|nr:hypothetical protein [Geodermatophilus sp. DF01_2]TFV61947.1 hypothetical protein E4P41_08670 [Geodermatophilus sp. DF01_2]